ncbi:NeuD/PglB/VioB family sugar acetyltransferase [Serratia nevei]|uniref:NeuD/PglB/VioB family sugar acetyltransferase n=1 Tax=Serratia nevei TaxID=2703794 RepID=UPI00209CB9E5|nr:NeuD/PglB/VioB family sugar acetyltransferase [Serratia nevei]MCP1108509.1 NeuD/PglB/VioB family sugar acetyltransferase [Serratia nevei]
MESYAIVGAGGCGREVLPVAVRMVNSLPSYSKTEFFFVVENSMDVEVNGVKVLSPSDFFKRPSDGKYFTVAIGDSKVRERIASEFLIAGATPFIVKGEGSLIYDTAEIGGGTILSPFVTVSANAKIGDFFYANVYSYVAHDCIIGDYVTFAAGVKCNGNVIIEDHAYIGAGAVIKEGSKQKPIVIGAGAIVGMGAVVTKSVPAGATVVGNPAKPLIKKDLLSDKH